MKMRNDDVKRITEIKQYLLDPPVSFRLYEYAPVYLRKAIEVLQNYPESKSVIDYFQQLAEQFETRQINQANLLTILKEAGIAISKLTSK
ncbi:MAG: hypothetical protein JST21_09030 [Bacteroidetes bacterium]|nr:hypothetical protein [Bacteroidota bacterium]